MKIHIMKFITAVTLATLLFSQVLFSIETTPPSDIKNDPTPALTLQTCIGIALDQNPSARAAYEGICIQEEAVGVAKAPYYPDLRLNASYTRFKRHIFLPTISTPFPVPITIPSTVGPVNDWNFALKSSYIIWDSGKRHAELMEALAQQGMAVEEALRIQQEIILNISVAFYDIISSTELIAVSEQNVQRTEAHVKLARQRLDAGAVPLSDVLRSQVEAANSKLELVRSQTRLKISEGNLNTFMGLPADTHIRVVTPNDEVTSPASIELCEIIATALESRPEIKQQQQKLYVYSQQIEVAKSEFGPKVVAEGSYGRRDTQFWPHDQEWEIGVGIELPLFKGFGPTHNYRKALDEYKREFAINDRIILGVRQEVWNAYSRLFESYELIQATLATVKDAKESLRLVEERYKAGAGTITDLLDANTNFAKAESQYVEAKWGYFSSKAYLAWAQGILGECD